jgi:hypothetical protein
MKTTLLFATLLLCLHGLSQNYPIGHATIVFNDPARTGGFGTGGGSGRQIQTEIYYPAASAGEDIPFANTTAPIIVFGHGFVMSWDAYMNLVDHYVPLGYILAFPRTEGSFTPSHLDFAKDLVVVANRMELENNNVGSLFYNALNGKKAIMGHSMGGGATFLALAETNASFDVAIGLAPAETNPSAVSAAANSSLPGIVLSGSSDAVTPPANHHQLIYNTWTSSCKTYVSITGGAHCYFANANLNCDFGEVTSGGNITINRATQHDIMFAVLDPFLAFHLLKACSSWNDFLTVLQVDNRFVENNDCNYQLPAVPVISQNGSMLSSSVVGSQQWALNGNDLNGENNQTLDWTVYGPGNYTVTVSDSVPCEIESFPFIPTLSVVDNSLSFSFYPNPVVDYLKIECDKSIEFELYSAVGQRIAHFSVSGTELVSLGHLKPGIYLVKTKSGIVRNLIKQ